MAQTMIEPQMLEACVRDELNLTATRSVYLLSSFVAVYVVSVHLETKCANSVR